MRKSTLFTLALLAAISASSQTNPANSLTVEKIMRDPKWIGTSPSGPEWSFDGKYLLFSWNPEKATSDSVYYITPTALTPKKHPGPSGRIYWTMPVSGTIPNVPNTCLCARAIFTWAM
ncbi:hypothetical protein [Paraflavitalea speifideaquila]|uniref:hypothetical protein n=1 Tax=Paraflavitalea speifideaquila TaxID=3076558 RepID=UPI0028EED4AC|nr:hypothetical protein [Paraflavitalea speifideiaquila]